ncbi:MAG: GNAT family N-acetyltransferase [Synergistaceae bacterium]|jgi:ribosomal-protein-alanine N-acetyltransferase|nr:GNAT family N-acetyltransferase [Synergistaceae bacterium]
MVLVDVRFCGSSDLGEVVKVDGTSPYPWPEEVIQKDIADGALIYIGAFYGASLLGYSALGADGGSGLLMNLVVEPRHRGLGIGSQLVVAAAECALSMGYPTMLLSVRSSNEAAISLYVGLGFVWLERRERYYSNGDAALRMGAALPLRL